MDDDTIKAIRAAIVKAKTSKAAKLIDPRLVEKRPALARQQLRELLTTKVQDEVANLLTDRGIPEKGIELVAKFKAHVYKLDPQSTNDATLVRVVLARLHDRFGNVKDRDNVTLMKSIDALTGIMDSLRKALS